MFAGDGFTAEAEVRAMAAHIGGSLALGGATLRNADGYALNLESASIKQLILREGKQTSTVVFISFGR